ncbi:RdRP-domain-containing protein [Hysterangium stoloniferum]|nr:RdRP-domain-containing protein [Hysterangium stoloniferum]
MDVFMRDIPYMVDDTTLTLELARVLHNPPFTQHAPSGTLINFKVHLLPDKKYRRHPHSGSGSLTLPSTAIGEEFLRLFCNGYRSAKLEGHSRQITFGRSNRSPRPDVLGEIRLMPYRNPNAIRETQAREHNLSGVVRLRDVQYLWSCRDFSYSVEWEWKKEDRQDQAVTYRLRFKEDTREVVVERALQPFTDMIAMRYSRIQVVEVDNSSRSLVFFLELPPSYERASTPNVPAISRSSVKRQKLDGLNDSHKLVGPFTWNIIRLVCPSPTDLAEFIRMAEVAGLHVGDRTHTITREGRFSPAVLDKVRARIAALPWSVAFQCEMLIRDQRLDARELLDIQPHISQVLRDRGPEQTEKVVKQFGSDLRRLWNNEDGETCEACFIEARNEVARNKMLQKPPDHGPRLFQCLHVAFTPSGMVLGGPFPDTSNRILRQYPKNHDSFLRVSWTDEDGQTGFRFDRREVDGPPFVELRVGRILKKGFELCGRKFEFLAYSQSALKQYTVWFVHPFQDSKGRRITAEFIRNSIGSDWSKETELMRCPARYAARLSQAFTATESSVFVEVDQIFKLPDIKRNGFCFSDGNGPMSREMAVAIQDALSTNGGGRNRSRRTPSAFQIRIQGAKGVISVDPTLSGLQLGLRPSMIKFESIHHNDVEIARSFDKPIKFFLNRPLIMILAGLGVGERIFLQLQKNAVQQTEQATRSLKSSAELLETHGMGASFALTSTFLNLRKLGISLDPTATTVGFRDVFVDRCLKFAVHHVLRELKFKARIPVPECWKLVGVVDVHNILRPHEIYACIIRGEGSRPEYLKGRILVSKSPTIHPGDVQIAEAIGEPKASSPLRHLVNCLVFSQRGDRPLPNQLSGSDLDGDEYDLVPMVELHPPRIVAPGEYSPTPRKLLPEGCQSNINDVADFIVDFVNNDMLGMVATNFLLIADRKGIFDPDCAKLAGLHSWAVDFPKNGIPVPIEKIPQSDVHVRPDWNAPEINIAGNANYYESQSILGKLFRAIDLPVLSGSNYETRAQPRRKRKGKNSTEDKLANLSLGGSRNLKDPISIRLQRKLSSVVDLVYNKDTAASISDLFDLFAAELENICFQHSLSRYAIRRLSEEEVLIGTIIAKSAQARLRRDNMISMRVESGVLVQRMLKELEGSADESIKDWANRAWMAWFVSQSKKDVFGARSFGFVALRAIFEAIKALES